MLAGLNAEHDFLEIAPTAAALRRPPPEGEEKHVGRPGVCFS